MAFTWPTKKEVREAGPKPEYPATLAAEIGDAPAGKSENPLKSAARETATRASAAESDPLPALTERLETLGQLLEEAKEQVTSYLLHRESQTSDDDGSRTLARKVEALAERLDQGPGGRGLEQKLDALYGKIDQLASASRGGGSVASSGEGGGAGVSEAALRSAVRPVGEKLDQMDGKLKSIDSLKEALVAAITKLQNSHAEQHNAQSAGIRQIGELVPQYFNALPQYFTAIQQQVAAAQQHADSGMRAILDVLRPPQPDSSTPAVGGDWQEALLGSELTNNGTIDFERNQLLNGVLGGDPGACGLVGSLLLFRAAAADKMPPLLKDIGEAFYRWQPKASGRTSEIEKALVDWLMRACDQAGMANTIELVSPGERFDSARHNASRPGVEVTQVLGWIVLRDNGKVYTKASVAVK